MSLPALSLNPYAVALRPHPYIQKQETESSFQAQVADSKLSSISTRAKILSGTFLPPIPKTPPKPFSGTRDELLALIGDRVSKTWNRLDYNGLPPYLKLLGQLQQGKSVRETEIDAEGEELGSTCIGMVHGVLQILQSEKIEGSLTASRTPPSPAFEHGAAIVECSDGFILFDATLNRRQRIHSIPFESTRQCEQFSIVAGKAGASIPLTFVSPEHTLEFGTHIANVTDLVMKCFVMANLDDFIPIALYNPDSSPRKSIKIYPLEGKLVLINHEMTKPGPHTKKVETVFFDAVRRGELLPKLEKFMEPHYCRMPPSFHTPISTMHNQIVALASQEERLKQLFTEVEI